MQGVQAPEIFSELSGLRREVGITYFFIFRTSPEGKISAFLLCRASRGKREKYSN